MSKWTSVNASFRIQKFTTVTEREILDVFGRQSNSYNSFDNEDAEKLLPKGSEGTLNINIWINNDESDTNVATVNVFGDLRDFDDVDEIEKWFNDCCGAIAVKQAVCQVYANDSVEIFQY